MNGQHRINIIIGQRLSAPSIYDGKVPTSLVNLEVAIN